MSLAQKAFSSILYSLSSKFIVKFILLGGSILLARILEPRDFGLIATVYIFFEISNFMIQGGFSMALIREESIDENDKATAFYFNLIVSIFTFIIMWFSAPFISRFYDELELVLIIRIMSLSLLFNALGLVQRAIYARKMKFKQIGIIHIIASIISVLVTIILAHLGYGVIALAIKFTIGNLVFAILLYVLMPWLPIGFIKKKSFNKLFSFGKNVMLLGFVNTISRNIHSVVIAKYYSIDMLGFYSQGRMLKDTIANTLSDSIMSVSFPVLSKIQSDEKRLKKTYVKLLSITSFLIFPVMSVLILAAEPIILVLLGEKWSESIPFLQIIGITGYLKHIHSINLNVLKVYGKGKDYLIQGVIRNGLTLLCIFIGAQYSVIAIAWAFVIADTLQLFVNIYYSNKYLSFSFKDQIKIMAPILLLNLGNFALIWFIMQINMEYNFIKLITITLSSFVFYIGMAIICKFEVYFYSKKMLLNKITLN